MIKRIYIPIVAAIMAQPMLASNDETGVAAVRRAPGDLPVSIALTTSLSETPVDSDSADHVRLLSFSAALSYELPKIDSDFVEDPSLSLSIGYSDQIDVEDNDSNLENTTLTFSGLGYKFSPNISVLLPASLVFATNEDDRKYRSYRGSILVSPSLTYAFTEGLLNNLSLSLNGRYNQSNYAYDTTKGETFNPDRAVSLGLSAAYSWQKFQFSGGFSNSTVYLADGSQLDDRYAASVAASFKQNEQLSYSFSWEQTDRTFGYSGRGSNINFTYADLTLLTFSLTYSI